MRVVIDQRAKAAGRNHSVSAKAAEIEIEIEALVAAAPEAGQFIIEYNTDRG